MLIVIGLYLLVNLSYMAVLGTSEMLESEAVAIVSIVALTTYNSNHCACSCRWVHCMSRPQCLPLLLYTTERSPESVASHGLDFLHLHRHHSGLQLQLRCSRGIKVLKRSVFIRFNTLSCMSAGSKQHPHPTDSPTWVLVTVTFPRSFRTSTSLISLLSSPSFRKFDPPFITIHFITTITIIYCFLTPSMQAIMVLFYIWFMNIEFIIPNLTFCHLIMELLIIVAFMKRRIQNREPHNDQKKLQVIALLMPSLWEHFCFTLQ